MRLATHWPATSAVSAGSGTARSTPRMRHGTLVSSSRAMRAARGSLEDSAVPLNLGRAESSPAVEAHGTVSSFRHKLPLCLSVLNLNQHSYSAPGTLPIHSSDQELGPGGSTLLAPFCFRHSSSSCPTSGYPNKYSAFQETFCFFLRLHS
jgi:hypothetical protein